MSAAVEVVEVGQLTLGELAQAVRAEHEYTQSAVSNALTHALLAGEALLAIRGQLSGRKWTRWLKENVPEITLVMAQTYMRIARYKEIVQDGEVVGIVQARQLLVGLPPATTRGAGRTIDPRVKSQAVELVSEGMKPKAVADLLGIGESAVRYWARVDVDEQRQRLRQRNRDAHKARQAKAEEDRQRAAKAKAKRKGGGIAECYSLAERLQDALGDAHREATDGDVRRALSEAGEHYRKMRDCVVHALGAA